MELSNITKQYWTEKDWHDLEDVKTVKDLYIIASIIVNRVPTPRVQVCGPISTGGKGSIENNLEVFNDRIKELQKEGLNVFDQMPFEGPMHKMVLDYTKKDEYLDDILTDFYLQRFESGNISELYFLPDWKSSYGAKWEHEQAERLKLKITYL